MTPYEEDLLQVSQLDLPWEKLSGSKVLIAGATGLIGSGMVDALMCNPKRDYEVYALGRNEERAKVRFKKYLNDRGFHFIKHNVMQPLQCDDVFDFIIHAASGASPNEFAMRPVEVVRSNIEGVVSLMEYGLSHKMKRFLYVSSGEVYGEGDGRVFTEEYSGYVDCTLPRSCYPSSKRASETLCVSYAAEYKADVVIARPCHVFGPFFTEADNRVYAQFIRNVLNNEDIVLKSTGSQLRNWCYVADCISALLYILLKGERSQAYNIANESASISILELARIIAGIGDKNVVMDIPDEKEKKGYNVVLESVFSTNKIKRLGWYARHDLRTALIRTIKTEKANRVSSENISG